jgi:hypothetical protein
MRTTSSRQTRPVLDCLEGRLVLSTAAMDTFGRVHILTSHRKPASPVIAYLSPDQSAIEITAANFDVRAKVITIKGTALGGATQPSEPYSPDYMGPTTVTVSLSATQAINRTRSISGYGSTENISATVGQSSPFVIRIVANAGYFIKGDAVLNLTASAYATTPSDSYYYWSQAAGMIVHLSPGRPK